MTSNFVWNHHNVLANMLHDNASVYDASVYDWIYHFGILSIQFVAVLSNTLMNLSTATTNDDS